MAKRTHVTVDGASRRPIRLEITGLPPEAVGRLGWGQGIWDELTGSHSRADPPPEEAWRRQILCPGTGVAPMCRDLHGLGGNDPRDHLAGRERETLALVGALVGRGRVTPKDAWGGKGSGISVVHRSNGGCRIDEAISPGSGNPTGVTSPERARMEPHDRYPCGRREQAGVPALNRLGRRGHRHRLCDHRRRQAEHRGLPAGPPPPPARSQGPRPLRARGIQHLRGRRRSAFPPPTTTFDRP